MIFDRIEWDEHNLDHATRRLTVAEIEQALFNADRWFRHPKHKDRRLVRAETVASRFWWWYRSCTTESDRSPGGRSEDDRQDD